MSSLPRFFYFYFFYHDLYFHHYQYQYRLFCLFFPLCGCYFSSCPCLLYNDVLQSCSFPVCATSFGPHFSLDLFCRHFGFLLSSLYAYLLIYPYLCGCGHPYPYPYLCGFLYPYDHPSHDHYLCGYLYPYDHLYCDVFHDRYLDHLFPSLYASHAFPHLDPYPFRHLYLDPYLCDHYSYSYSLVDLVYRHRHFHVSCFSPPPLHDFYSFLHFPLLYACALSL
mmetsp:Transcript_26302/g.25133  ORF Transcript_26302/g.25133 Transcript_26302/m.25133 type:complete len:222 (+) Transcript_26302:478-1143(+)